MRRTMIALSAALALAPAAARAETGSFVTTQGADQWRASKVIGIIVLGPDGKQVGTVADVLMDHGGQAADVVIGVGGFLGVGQKDVALPYAQVHFTNAPGPGATATATSAAQENGAFLSANGGIMGRGMMDGAEQPPPPNGSKGPSDASATAAVGGPVGTTSGVPGGQATGLAPTPTAPPGGTATSARNAAGPDHATVDLTAEQLKAAPAFTYMR